MKQDATKSTAMHHAFKTKPEDFQSAIDDLPQIDVEVFDIDARTKAVFWGRRCTISIRT